MSIFSIALIYGSFTLPDTDTYTETDTNEMCTEPIKIYIGLGLGRP